jgi:hypothetical protein
VVAWGRGANDRKRPRYRPYVSASGNHTISEHSSLFHGLRSGFLSQVVVFIIASKCVCSLGRYEYRIMSSSSSSSSYFYSQFPPSHNIFDNIWENLDDLLNYAQLSKFISIYRTSISTSSISNPEFMYIPQSSMTPRRNTPKHQLTTQSSLPGILNLSSKHQYYNNVPHSSYQDTPHTSYVDTSRIPFRLLDFFSDTSEN